VKDQKSPASEKAVMTSRTAIKNVKVHVLRRNILLVTMPAHDSKLLSCFDLAKTIMNDIEVKYRGSVSRMTQQ
jgi:hypothetical protein